MIKSMLKEIKKDSFFSRFIMVNKNIFYSMITLTVFYAILGIPAPYLSRYLIDDVFLKQNYGSLMPIITAFIFLIVSQTFIGRIAAKNKARFFKNFLIDTQLKIFKSYLRNWGMPTVSTQRLQTIINSDVELLCSNYLQIIEVIFSNGIHFVGYTLVLLAINTKLFLITIIFVPVYIAWTVFYAKRIQKYINKSQHSKELIIKNILSTTSNYIPIKIYDFITPKIKSFESVVNENGENTERLINYQNIVNIVANLIVVIATFIPLFLGMFFINSGDLSLGELIAFNSYSVQLFSPLTSIVGLISTVKITDVYEERIQIFLNEMATYDKKYFLDNKGLTNTLSVNNLKLYSKKEVLLSIPSLSIEKGKLIRITGENGTGKSLFLKAVSNLYGAFTGNIYIEGLDTRNLHYENWKQNVIFIDNTHQFPLETINDELSYSEINKDQVSDVLDIVFLNKKMDELSEGLLTKNHTVMETFSNGELQRYRIARALLRNPKLLILDEVFSNIDIVLSTNILNNIRDKFPEMTILFVEHKTTENMFFDQEYIIKNHRLVQLMKEE